MDCLAECCLHYIRHCALSRIDYGDYGLIQDSKCFSLYQYASDSCVYHMRAIEDQESDSTIALMLSILNSYKCRSLWSQSHALVDGFHITYKHRKPPWSPLFYACASGLHGISKVLLDSGVDPNESNEPYGTALHKSLSMGSLESCNYCLKEVLILQRKTAKDTVCYTRLPIREM